MSEGTVKPMTISTNRDPLGYRDEVLRAMSDPIASKLFALRSGEMALTSDSQTWPDKHSVFDSNPGILGVANRIVSSVGHCRVFGIAISNEVASSLDGPWPPELIVAGIEELNRTLRVAIEQAERLPRTFDESEPLEDRDHCTGFLHLAMESWAMFVSIEEQYQLHLEKHNDLDSPFSLLMDLLIDKIEALDRRMQSQEVLEILSVATELPLLENWRKMLAEPYRSTPPWWLDGTLEKVSDNHQLYLDKARIDSVQQSVKSQLSKTSAWVNDVRRKDQDSPALAASSSRPRPTDVCTLNVDGDPNTIVRLTADVENDAVCFLLQRSPDAPANFDPLDVYDRIEVVDDKGIVHGQILTALPSKVTLAVDNQIESISLIAKSPDHRKHALFDRSQ